MIIAESITPLGVTAQETTGAGSYVAVGIAYEVLAERIEFWADDDIGMFYAYFPAPSVSEVYTVIKIIDSNETVVDQVVAEYGDTTNRFSFQVDIDSLDFDDYIVEVSVLNNHVDAAGGVTLGGEATSRVSDYSYEPDGIGLILSGISEVSAEHFNYTFEGGVTLGSSAETAHSYYIYTAEGGVTLGEQATETMGTITEADGGLTLAGTSHTVVRYNVTPTVSNVEDKFSCLAAGYWWCGEFNACIEQGSESIIFQGALIPAITICNSSKQVIRVTNRNVVN